MQSPGATANIPGFVLERIASRKAAHERMAAAPGDHGYSSGWAEAAAYVLDMLDIELPQSSSDQQQPAA